MKFKLVLSVFAFVAMSATTVFAADSMVSFTAEPYVGYGLLGGVTKDDGKGTSTDLGNFTGFGLGARGLVNFAGLFFGGIDLSYYPSFSYSPANGRSETSSGGIDKGTKSFKGGLVAGVALPVIPLRFWLGFNVIDRLSDSSSGTTSGVDFTTDTTVKGHSFKIGAGYRPIPLLSLNVEYIMASYGESETTTKIPTLGYDQKTTDTTSSVKHNLLMLTASVPFTF
jgi:hypothetical protein